LRGHGESDWAPEGRYAPADFVGDLEAVCEQLGQPPVLVGASLGGITGLLAEGRRPGLVAALVLVDITPNVEPKGIERIMRFMLEKPEGFESLEEAAESVARYRQHRARPSDLSGLRKNLRHGDDGRWRWHWDPAFVDRARGQELLAEGVDAQEAQQFMNGEELMDAARSLKLPVLLVRGKASDVVSADGADAFLDAVPHARYADVAGAGHMVAGDRNDAFNDAVLDFLHDAFA
jgi:pimeloyl-ACP methyl ester carboxylesterase